MLRLGLPGLDPSPLRFCVSRSSSQDITDKDLKNEAKQFKKLLNLHYGNLVIFS